MATVAELLPEIAANVDEIRRAVAGIDPQLAAAVFYLSQALLKVLVVTGALEDRVAGLEEYVERVLEIREVDGS